jgi:methionyl-tRNA synthetase
MREMPLGDDGDFSEQLLKARNNNELASDLGNLVYRVLTMTEKYEGKLEGSPELEKSLELKTFQDEMDRYDTYRALETLWRFIKASNKYINDTKPWELKGEVLSNALYNSVEACRIISILISPFMPETADKINKQLGIPLGRLEDCRFSKIGYLPKKGAPLFTRVD